MNLKNVLFGIYFAFLSCSLAEDSQISLQEANLRIAAAYLAKDAECGASHSLTVPIFAKANQKDIETCMIEILGAKCQVWNSADNLPLSCIAISIKQ